LTPTTPPAKIAYMHATINIDDDLAHALEHLLATTGVTLGTVVNRALRRELAASNETEEELREPFRQRTLPNGVFHVAPHDEVEVDDDWLLRQVQLAAAPSALAVESSPT
jgi:hypothetical protein